MFASERGRTDVVNFTESHWNCKVVIYISLAEIFLQKANAASIENISSALGIPL